MNIKTLRWHFTIYAVTGLILLGGHPEGMAQERTSKFLVAPFKIHADRDLSYLQRGLMDMVVTRLSSKKTEVIVAPQSVWDAVASQSGLLSEAAAAALGAKQSADYVVFGSLTIIGDNVSTNAQCLDVRSKTSPVVFTQAGKSMGDVIPQVHQFAAAIREKILGEKPLTETAAASGVAPQAESRRNPEAVWQETSAASGFGLPGIIRTQPTDASGQFTVWRSPELEEDYVGIAAEDVDGDRKVELVTISERTLVVWRYDSGRLVKLTELKTNQSIRFLSVDAADINGNGKAEIFVSAIYPDSQRLSSLVAESSGASLNWIAEGESMYFRVIRPPGGKPQLYGQAWGGNEPFSSAVYQVAWHAGSYTRTEREPLPKNINLFSFAKGNIKGDTTQQKIFITSQAMLQIQNADGTTAWTGADGYSGTGVFVDYPDEQFEVNPKNGALGRYYLPQRIHLQDVDGDGVNEVILADNVDRTGRVLPRTRMFKEGRVRCLSWSQLGLYEEWQTQPLSGHVSDTAIADLDNDGIKELIVSVIPPLSFSLSQPKSYIVMWKITKK